jgi:hypothetical protein
LLGSLCLRDACRFKNYIMICGWIFLASFCYDFGIHDPYKDKAMMDGKKEWFHLAVGLLFLVIGVSVFAFHMFDKNSMRKSGL